MSAGKKTGRGAGRSVRRARGSVDPRRPFHKQIAIQFDHSLFDELAERAAGERVSFAELVRTFCEWGLETTDDGGAAQQAKKGAES